MTVTIAVSTRGMYKTFSSVNVALETALSDVYNALESQNISKDKVDFRLTHNGTNYVFVAIVQGGCGTNYS